MNFLPKKLEMIHLLFFAIGFLVCMMVTGNSLVESHEWVGKGSKKCWRDPDIKDKCAKMVVPKITLPNKSKDE